MPLAAQLHGCWLRLPAVHMLLRRPAAAAVVVSLAAGGLPACDDDVKNGGDNVPLDGDRPTDSPLVPGGAAEGPSDEQCPQLEADVPDDLDHRSEHQAVDPPFPVSVGVIWSNDDGTRVVNVSSTSSAEEFGDGTDAKPTEREVQGVAGTEIVVGQVRRITWRPDAATPGCSIWVLVTQGLSRSVLDRTLASVREASP